MIYWFWTIFVGAIILWYILVTVVVGIKGAGNIQDIFKQMKDENKPHGNQV